MSGVNRTLSCLYNSFGSTNNFTSACQFVTTISCYDAMLSLKVIDFLCLLICSQASSGTGGGGAGGWGDILSPQPAGGAPLLQPQSTAPQAKAPSPQRVCFFWYCPLDLKMLYLKHFFHFSEGREQINNVEFTWC